MEPCHQGSKIPTDCWNTTEHVVLRAQSQRSLPIHQHCSIGCIRCKAVSPLYSNHVFGKETNFLFCEVHLLFPSIPFYPAVALLAAPKDDCLATLVWPPWWHIRQLQFLISARVGTSVLFKWVLLITQQTDHRDQTSATRSSFFSDTWEYCHGVNDLYLLKAFRAVHWVQEQESVHF